MEWTLLGLVLVLAVSCVAGRPGQLSSGGNGNADNRKLKGSLQQFEDELNQFSSRFGQGNSDNANDPNKIGQAGNAPDEYAEELQQLSDELKELMEGLGDSEKDISEIDFGLYIDQLQNETIAAIDGVRRILPKLVMMLTGQLQDLGRRFGTIQANIEEFSQYIETLDGNITAALGDSSDDVDTSDKEDRDEDAELLELMTMLFSKLGKYRDSPGAYQESHPGGHVGAAAPASHSGHQGHQDSGPGGRSSNSGHRGF